MGVFDFFKNRRRDAQGAVPLTDAQQKILAHNVPYVAKLDADERRELEALIQVFLAEKSFEGCGGLTITEEIRLTIAAQACLLLLHRDTDMYPRVDSILVYPTAYLAPHRAADGHVVLDGLQARLGETSLQGAVVLAWDQAQYDALNTVDGHNVVMHEFAHQLDGEDGKFDGVPTLPWTGYRMWAHVLGHEYQELVTHLEAGALPIIDDYAATNPAEFFAVVTEMFFERGPLLLQQHPALYAQLKAFYHQDPAAR
ncbi:MAG TPA: zinc-dependent peptidase [Kofleriaceae bacterium]|nr:zinc-dependent peptidase [Kofleriaceae bacterium]